MSQVKIENLVKSYDGRRVVDNLTLELKEGELFALLGSSGCGKTTTLRCVAGLEPFEAGRIFFDDQDISAVPAHCRDCGMVFQNYALFPHLNILNNVAYGLMARRYREAGFLGKLAVLARSAVASLTAEDMREVLEVLKLVELRDCAERMPAQLSGGQQQRAALARALVTRPRVLLFDEPLGALDAKLRIKMREEIRAIQKRAGITSLYVTHDQEEALAIADRLALMDKGKIVQMGTPEDIYLHPASRFTAEFLGLTNIFSGEIVSRGSARLEDGFTLAVEASDKFELGDRCTIVVRPQAVKIDPLPEGGKGGVDNEQSGKLAGTAVVNSTGVTRSAVETAVQSEPEKNDVLNTPNGLGSNNVFTAKVITRMFMGDFTKYVLACDQGIYNSQTAATVPQLEAQPQTNLVSPEQSISPPDPKSAVSNSIIVDSLEQVVFAKQNLNAQLSSENISNTVSAIENRLNSSAKTQLLFVAYISVNREQPLFEPGHMVKLCISSEDIIVLREE